jgi:hypothetical protein
VQVNNVHREKCLTTARIDLNRATQQHEQIDHQSNTIEQVQKHSLAMNLFLKNPKSTTTINEKNQKVSLFLYNVTIFSATKDAD